MTGGQSLTYMATDIIGFSLLTQKDQRKAIGLLETYQSILIPLIEKEGGSGIVSTGDAITACFNSSQSAIRAGFAILMALKGWNHSSPAERLTTRIGIHASGAGDKDYLQQLSQIIAKSLESLGSENALCISSSVLQETRPEMRFYDYPLGSYELDYLPEPLSVSYLYEKRPGLISRLGLQLNYLKSEYVEKKLKTYSLAAVMSLVLFLAVLLFNIGTSDIRYIEIAETNNYSGNDYEDDVRELSRLIRFKLDKVTGLKVIQTKNQQQADTHLTSGFQRIGDDVRLTWAALDRSGEVQVSGGDVVGDIDDLDDLEKLFIQDVISQIVNQGSSQ